MIGCLVDTLLILNIDAQKSEGDSTPPKMEDKIDSLADIGQEDEGLEMDASWMDHVPLLAEDECRVLFSTLCIHGIPKLHARAIALLIKFGGSQHWWGDFLVQMAVDMFGAQQAAIFNKER